MDTEALQRIATLEAEVARLHQEVTERKAMSSFSSDRVTPDQTDAVTRRRLLRGGGLVAAGAAGVLAGSSNQPASAQAVDAGDVTFDPVGDISATNVQEALEEVDTEKAALAGAEFTGTTLLADAQFAARPWVDLRARGAAGNGTTDDTAALIDAINRVSFFGGGTVLVPPGRYRFTEPVVIPEGVDIWGCGGHLQAAHNRGTILLADSTNAYLSIKGQGGLSGNFMVRGQNTAAPDRGLVNIDAVERQFTALRVVHSETDGLVVDRSQNCTFTQLLVAHCDRDGIVLDAGAGGNSFIRCEFTNNRHDNIRIRDDGGPGPFAGVPSDNVFFHCIAERGSLSDGVNNTQLHVTAGERNWFSHCAFASGPGVNSISGWLAMVEDGLTAFENSYFTGTSANGLNVRGNGVVTLLGQIYFNCPTAIQWDDNARGRVLCRFEYGDPVTTRWTGSGNYQNISTLFQTPVIARAENGAAFSFRTEKFGEGYRFEVDEDGNVHLNGGALALQEMGTTPPNPPSGNRAVVYVKDDKLVVAFNDGGTMRYKYLPLSTVSADWVHTTTAP